MASVAFAQTATVTYTYPTIVIGVPVTLLQVQTYIPTLQVNGMAFPLTHTCVLTPGTPSVFTCTAPLPNITTGLTPSGSQSFTVTLKDVILEGQPSLPFVLQRPAAPSPPVIR